MSMLVGDIDLFCEDLFLVDHTDLFYEELFHDLVVVHLNVLCEHENLDPLQ